MSQVWQADEQGPQVQVKRKGEVMSLPLVAGGGGMRYNRGVILSTQEEESLSASGATSWGPAIRVSSRLTR